MPEWNGMEDFKEWNGRQSSILIPNLILLMANTEKYYTDSDNKNMWKCLAASNLMTN